MVCYIVVYRWLPAAMVTILDDAINDVTQTLKRTGLYKDSLIVFMSDVSTPVLDVVPGMAYTYRCRLSLSIVHEH